MTNKFPKIEIEVARYLKKEHDEMVEYFTKIMSYYVPELQDSKIAVWVKTEQARIPLNCTCKLGKQSH